MGDILQHCCQNAATSPISTPYRFTTSSFPQGVVPRSVPLLPTATIGMHLPRRRDQPHPAHRSNRASSRRLRSLRPVCPPQIPVTHWAPCRPTWRRPARARRVIFEARNEASTTGLCPSPPAQSGGDARVRVPQDSGLRTQDSSLSALGLRSGPLKNLRSNRKPAMPPPSHNIRRYQLRRAPRARVARREQPNGHGGISERLGGSTRGWRSWRLAKWFKTR